VSGFAGILHLDRAPVERQLLQRLTNFQAFRGPDAQQVWLAEYVGFGHTLLRTTEESEHEYQPFSLDGKTLIVADARVDARLDLIAELHAHGHEDVPADAPDVELILRSYHVWGDDCVLHLIGDFAFAIWDGSHQRLFCARDHMGVKPFFYAHLGSLVVFSNTLDCIRQHPAVSNKLNDQAIADFLLFELNQDAATTSFADIQRLKPAHRAVWSLDGLRISRFWTMPVDEPVFYKRSEEYVERFKELLGVAIADRIRTNRVGVFLSGGLDSTTIAATSRDVLRDRHGSPDILAITQTDADLPREHQCAGQVAQHLGIPIQYFDWGRESVDPEWEQKPRYTSEPTLDPWTLTAYQKYWRQIESSGRVFFYGEGPDNALQFEWRPYISYLVRRRQYGRLARDLSATLISQWRPPFWTRITSGLQNWWTGEKERESSFPAWLNQDLEARLQLRTRWQQFFSPANSVHPLRPQGYASFQIALWQDLFEWHDAGRTRSCYEVRHPFMDLRVLRYLLAVPALPWCRAKYLLRRSMRGILPKSILRRPKSGLPCATIMERVRGAGLAPFVPAPGLSCYVAPERVPTKPTSEMWEFGGDLRTRALNLWLQKYIAMRQTYGVEDYLSDEPNSKPAREAANKEII
jgi:asparagine synthase (glutamine-hydrolysing)